MTIMNIRYIPQCLVTIFMIHYGITHKKSKPCSAYWNILLMSH